MKGTAGQSGNSTWRKKDTFGVVTREQQRCHWWYQV
jgi:hypothetical protein